MKRRKYWLGWKLCVLPMRSCLGCQVLRQCVSKLISKPIFSRGNNNSTMKMNVVLMDDKLGTLGVVHVANK
jgi:hypothetical protein